MELPWDALAPSPEQVNKLVPAIHRLPVGREVGPGAGGPRSSQPPAPKALVDACAASNKEVEAILTAEQLKRAEGLLFRGRVANSLFTVLQGPSGAAFELTPEQRNRMTVANAELTGVAGLVSAAGLPGELDTEVRLLLRNRLDDRILAVFTAKEKAAWQERGGSPYAGFAKRPLGDEGSASPTTEPDSP